MATSWKSQLGHDDYRLQFETDDREKYKLVEKAAQMATDGIKEYLIVCQTMRSAGVLLEALLRHLIECEIPFERSKTHLFSRGPRTLIILPSENCRVRICTAEHACECMTGFRGVVRSSKEVMNYLDKEIIKRREQ